MTLRFGQATLIYTKTVLLIVSGGIDQLSEKLRVSTSLTSL